MPFNMAEFKADCRQALHETLAVSAIYSTVSAPATEPNITVRWHTKQQLLGDNDNQGYAETIEGVERLIFNIPELVAKGITLAKQAIVEIPWPDGTTVRLRLDTREPSQGPVETVWLVVRL